MPGCKHFFPELPPHLPDLAGDCQCSASRLGSCDLEPADRRYFCAIQVCLYHGGFLSPTRMLKVSASTQGFRWGRGHTMPSLTLHDASALTWAKTVGLQDLFLPFAASMAVMCFRTPPLGVLQFRSSVLMSCYSSGLHMQAAILKVIMPGRT